MPPIGEREIRRFLRKLERRDGCLVWTGRPDAHGYGHITIAGQRCLVSRIAWRIFFGFDPGELHVLHTCDNPPCVQHLYLGTHATNMADMRSKGRMSPPPPSNSNARLTPAVVCEIRRLAAIGDLTNRQLAQHFGVTHTTINSVVKRKSWKELP